MLLVLYIVCQLLFLHRALQLHVRCKFLMNTLYHHITQCSTCHITWCQWFCQLLFLSFTTMSKVQIFHPRKNTELGILRAGDKKPVSPKVGDFVCVFYLEPAGVFFFF